MHGSKSENRRTRVHGLAQSVRSLRAVDMIEIMFYPLDDGAARGVAGVRAPSLDLMAREARDVG
jgi:hypothetical protein